MIKKTDIRYTEIIITVIAVLVLEAGLYWINHQYKLFTPYFYTARAYKEKHEGGGVLTNPLLECLGNDDLGINEHNISERELNNEVNKEIKENDLAMMSVYVRDMNNGPWIGINQNEEFLGGSLLKVPMLISYLKLSESNPDLLSKKVEYIQQITSNLQYYSPSKQIEVGHTYTIEQLLEYMIIYSDNNAAELLLQNIDKKEFDNVFRALGMGDPDPNHPYSVNAKTYAGFFRILFNASYLNKQNSEKALAILSKTEFNRGLQAEIPKNLTVSHKFGIRTDGNINQLHDCGIVYYPEHPYLLCIMSRGGTFDDMAKSISHISKFIYTKFNTND